MSAQVRKAGPDDLFLRHYTYHGLLHEEGYAKSMEQLVSPYLAACRRDEKIRTPDGAFLFTSCFPAATEPARGTVMILHGFTENTEKYREVIYALLQNGWNVVSYDQRGHGRSYRDPGVKSNEITYIDHFEQYVEDFGRVYRYYMQDVTGRKILFSHSMGGAVAALGLEKDLYAFDKAVFSSPMIAPRRGHISLAAAEAACMAFIAAGQGKERLFTAKPYTGSESFEDSCATSKARFDWYAKLRKSDPDLLNYNASYRWALESMKVTGKILAKGKVERITIPVRVYSAEREGTVLVEPQKHFVHRLPQGKFVEVPKAKHEIYRSVDEVLYPWWNDMLKFMEA